MEALMIKEKIQVIEEIINKLDKKIWPLEINIESNHLIIYSTELPATINVQLETDWVVLVAGEKWNISGDIEDFEKGLRAYSVRVQRMYDYHYLARHIKNVISNL